MPRWWWFKRFWLFLSLMTGGRCRRRKKMMGRGHDGGCGTDERPCRPISRVPASQTDIISTTKRQHTSFDIDFFSQAYKALSVRSPFDFPECRATSASAGGGLSVCTLPNGLASLLKQYDSRKRHKKSHSNADKKASRAVERSKGGNIWVEAEGFFRDLALPDIDALFNMSSSLRSLAARECFLIPCIGTEKNEHGNEVVDTNLSANCGNGNAHVNKALHTNATQNPRNGNEHESQSGNEDEHGKQDMNGNEHASQSMNGDEHGKHDRNGNEHGNQGLVNDGVKLDDEQFMEIDSVGAQKRTVETLAPLEVDYLPKKGKVDPIPESSSGLEWLLGCTNRVLLTSERPSKKLKLLGTDAGLEKVLISSPCEGNSSICDFCCKGQMGNKSDRLIVCSSCKVAVHHNFYAVKEDEEGSWACSWCNRKVDDDDDDDSVKQPCVICPKGGGALKSVSVENNGSAVEFAHLFCSLWMPEVYVEDLKNMEPIIGVREKKETRRKLLCNLCKVKCGACVRCSHGIF